jgi:hypothetical protein
MFKKLNLKNEKRNIKEKETEKKQKTKKNTNWADQAGPYHAW